MNGAVVQAARVQNPGERVRTDGNTIVWDTVGEDGTTSIGAVRYTSFQSLPLAGPIESAPAEVRSWPPLAMFSTNTSLVRPNAHFLAGARYFKRQAVRAGDAVFLGNCGAFSTGGASPCTGIATVEAAFPHTYMGTTFTLADGSVQTLQGLRAWISTAPLAASVSATPSHLVFVEHNGTVLRGLLQRDGTPIRSRLADGTVVDYSLRFNQQAVDSLRAALAF